MVILGLDSSTTTTGWAFSDSGKILDAGFIDTKKLKTNKEKAYHVISHIESNKYGNKFECINLEAALSGFAGGFTSQQTIITLTRFNAAFEYILREHFNKELNLLAVNTVRKYLFGKCRVTGVKSKDFVRYELESLIPEVNNFTVNNKRNNWDQRNSDMYDAVVCSLYKNKSA